MILVALMIVFQVVVFTMGFIAGVIYGRRRSAARLAAARSIALTAAQRTLIRWR